MMQSPETRPSLLLRVRDTADQAAWQDFVRLYAPLIYGFGIKRGLQDADAADVAQQVLQWVSVQIPRFEYTPEKGTFRGWLFAVSRNFVLKALDKKKRTPIATGDTSFQVDLAQRAGDSEEEALWDREHELRLFHWAADRAKVEFRDRTWKAFWAVAVEGQPVAVVAEQLGMSVGAVYIARSRVTSHIRKTIETLDEQ